MLPLSAMNEHRDRVCPWWLGYVLVNPIRRLFEHPRRLLEPLVREGMTVLEPGCGMGYFTLEAARLVGPSGKVVALDLQKKMINGLKRRLRRAHLSDRVDARVVPADTLAIPDLEGEVDMALALYFVHEAPDAFRLFRELARALKPGGRILFVEPRGHVSEAAFRKSLEAAQAAGLQAADGVSTDKRRATLLRS